MNGFYKMQERLRELGWFVEWNMPCCQSCAWGDVPWKADLSKVLFNHSQDCTIDDIDFCECDGGVVYTEDDDVHDCPECNGTAYRLDQVPEYALREHGFFCNPPDHQEGSMFCFDSSEDGVENLKEILPIIKECGCDYDWSGSPAQRIYISW